MKITNVIAPIAFKNFSLNLRCQLLILIPFVIHVFELQFRSYILRIYRFIIFQRT